MLLRQMRALLALALALSVAGLLGCKASAEPDVLAPKAATSFSVEQVRTGLEERFGARLGRMQAWPEGLNAELAGQGTDADLAAALLLLAPTASGVETVTVSLLDPDANWDCLTIEWNPVNGRLERTKGDGAEFMVLPWPTDGSGYGWAGERTREGGLPSGVDAAALKRYAAGEPVPWDWSMR